MSRSRNTQLDFFLTILLIKFKRCLLSKLISKIFPSICFWKIFYLQHLFMKSNPNSRELKLEKRLTSTQRDRQRKLKCWHFKSETDFNILISCRVVTEPCCEGIWCWAAMPATPRAARSTPSSPWLRGRRPSCCPAPGRGRARGPPASPASTVPVRTTCKVVRPRDSSSWNTN